MTQYVPSATAIEKALLDGTGGSFTSDEFRTWLREVEFNAWERGYLRGLEEGEGNGE